MCKLRDHLRRALWFVFVAVAMGAASWAQTAGITDKQFEAYHESLSGAADGLLKAPAQRKEGANLAAAEEAPQSVNDNFTGAVARVQKLRPLLEPILREEGVPPDMAAVVLVESGGRPAALSPKGALGLWQLMPETARRYGLVVTAIGDERLDPVKATRAATRYLRDLYAQFGDWRLAFAAYNAGEQAVQRAIMRSGSRDFQRLHAFLPNETWAYVPAVMTARPLFGSGKAFSDPTLRAARTAHVVYASAQLDNRYLSKE